MWRTGGRPRRGFVRGGVEPGGGGGGENTRIKIEKLNPNANIDKLTRITAIELNTPIDRIQETPDGFIVILYGPRDAAKLLNEQSKIPLLNNGYRIKIDLFLKAKRTIVVRNADPYIMRLNELQL